MERIAELVHTSLAVREQGAGPGTASALWMVCCGAQDILHNFSVLTLNQYLSKSLSGLGSEGVGYGSGYTWVTESKGKCERTVGVTHTPQSHGVRVSSRQSLVYFKTGQVSQSSFSKEPHLPFENLLVQQHPK